jgi:restriction endonuclease S subunit
LLFLNSATGRFQILAVTKQVTISGVDSEGIKGVSLVVPPLPEQLNIIGYLAAETAQIDALIVKVREGIEKLKEYRTSLISAAVTGKIDVREDVVA